MSIHHRPHSLQPQRDTARVAFAYKNFAATRGISHTGLGVSSSLTATVLWRQGIHTDVIPVTSAKDIESSIAGTSGQPVSHVVIAAPWIEIGDLQRLCMDHRGVEWCVICHSDVGFLQADPGAIQRLKEMSGLASSVHNFTLAGNNERFVHWAQAAITPTFRFLPNLYDVTTFRHTHRPPVRRPIRIGCYGALRPLKNIITAAAAALQISQVMRTDVEFHVNGGREEGSVNALAPVRQMISGHRMTLVVDNWRPWPEFRTLIGSMDLLLQPSYTESFNMVTADGIAEGVPSAVSETIEWVPAHWIARAHDAHSLAKTGMALLHDHAAAHEGQEALKRYVKHGTHEWLEYLT